MIDKEAQRAAFEAWYCKQYWNFKETDPGLWTGSSYRHLSVELAWNSWQAAQSQPAERLRVAEVDAARYHWFVGCILTGHLDDESPIANAFKECDPEKIPTIEEFNAAIDAAIAKEQTP